MIYDIKGTNIIADEGLFDLISKDSVYVNKSLGYAVVSIKGEKTLLHRLIMNAQKGEIVDHINHDRLDNRRENLRIVNKSLNNYNRPSTNKLGRGIYFDKYGDRYRACISHSGKNEKLG